MADLHQDSRHPLPPPPPSHEHYSHQDTSYDYNQQQQQQQPQQQQRQQQRQQTSPISPQQPAFAQQPPRQPQQYQQQQLQQLQQQIRQPPAAQIAHQQKPSKSRTFSFGSGKSRRSSTSHPRHDDTHETSAEKESHRLHSKADPTMAISEAEPDTESTPQNGRRSSYYAGNNGARYPQDSYYGGRPNSVRPESTHMDYNSPNRSGYFDGGSYGQGGYGPGPSRQRAPRMNSEPMNGYGRGGQQVYPIPHKDRSYETVTTAAGSGHSEQAGYQTDPTSSDNSSIDRVSPAKRAEPTNDYGIGFNQQGAYQPAAFNNYASGANGAGPSGANYRPAPMTNLNSAAPPAAPQKLGGGMLRKQTTQQSTQSRPDVGEKRKSWFSRRFSKAN
ncbi:conserved hypothetical protein [Verticillium alfalfae VaMs.102]|uniref:DUF2406 domain-containing protein n=1 Tax=Verticillium alfalfae (strain VaMs.102 / ATCC MYA-4576 / FGSC 10136) TaxID=526221 RepID=C9SIR8_VERA1|nr:conserved hypothetical protein [Verticillium alfalfae VaMs.102]EEY18841.1 conserved hypothetical protein [Verticillium alfalfae VaMs.102]